MAEFSTQCPHCRVKIRLKNAELEGKNVKCPACSEAFVARRLPSAGKSAQKSGPPKEISRTSRVPKKAGAAVQLQDTDFPVDDRPIANEPESSDDAWLDALDSLAPKEPVGAKSATAPAPAPVRGRPKKQAASKTQKRRRSLRDADGEFPLWLSRLMMIGTGFAAGGLCMVIWAAVISKTGQSSMYMATVVGAMVGGGVRLGASKWDFGWFPAVTAAVIALAAIIGGKVYGVRVLQQQAIDREILLAECQLKMAQHENYPLHLMAEEIHEMYVEQELHDTLTFHEPYLELVTESEIRAAYDPERFPEAYGQARWSEARARWESLSEEERTASQNQIAEEVAYLSSMLEPAGRVELQQRADQALSARGGALSPFDFLFAVIALVGAFKFAAGLSGGDE